MPRINVTSPEGRQVSVPAEEAAIWEARGYKPLTDETKLAQEAHAGVLAEASNPVGAFLGSAASGATLGLSDFLMADRDTALTREASPTLSTAGQIAGAVIPSLLTGGTAAAGTGARAAATGIAKFTPAGAASLAGAKLTTAIGAGGGRIAQVAGMGIGAAVEGAAQMTGQYMAETAMADKPLTAEGFFGAMGKGAMWGGALGGAIGVAAQGATAARKLFAGSDVTADAARAAQTQAAQRARKATDAGDESVMVAKRRLMEIRLEDATADAAAKQAEREYAVLVAEQKLRAQTAAADLAERQAKDIAERGAPLTPAEIKAQTAQRLGDTKVKAAEQATLRKAAEFDAKMAAREKALEVELKAKGQSAAQKLKAQKELDKIKVDRAKALAKTSGKAPKSTAPKAELVDQTDDLIGEVPIGMVDDVPPMGAVDELAPPVAAVAEEAALPSLEDFVDDAVARVSPEAAGIVKATRQYKKARLGMTQIRGADEVAEAATKAPRGTAARQTDKGLEWSVDGPQGGGKIWITSEELAQSTLGRIKSAFKRATPAQREYVESLMEAKRIEAVRGLEAGTVDHMPWWFNKDHHFEGETFNIKNLVGSDDIQGARDKVWRVRADAEYLPDAPFRERVANEGKLTDWTSRMPRVDQHGDVYDAETLHMIGVIGDFDKSMQAMGQALGSNAPQSLADEVAELMEQVAKSEDNDIAAMAAHLDDSAGRQAIDDATRIARGSDPNIKPPDDMMPPSAGAANANAPAGGAAQPAAAARVMDPDKAVANAMLPEAAAKESTGLLGYAADAGAALDALQTLGGAIPGVPRISEIPLIGPVLSMFLKARAAFGILGRLGGKIPMTVEGTIASKAAATRDRIRIAADKLIAGAEVGLRAAKRVAVPASASLERVLFSSGATVSHGGGLPARLQELAIAANNPQDVERRIRENVPTADAELVAQIIDVAKRKLALLHEKAPKDPRPPSMISGPYMPSKAQTETFARYVRAAEDPASVFEDAADGILSVEGVEVLTAVYPRLYQEAQTRLMERADKMQQSVPYTRRLLLGSLFGVPIDGTMTPEYRSAMAAASQAGGPSPEGNAPQQGVAPSIAGSAAKVAQMADPNANRKRGAM